MKIHSPPSFKEFSSFPFFCTISLFTDLVENYKWWNLRKICRFIVCNRYLCASHGTLGFCSNELYGSIPPSCANFDVFASSSTSKTSPHVFLSLLTSFGFERRHRRLAPCLGNDCSCEACVPWLGLSQNTVINRRQLLAPSLAISSIPARAPNPNS